MPIREIHNYLIKQPSYVGFDGARSKYGELLIGDILLGKNMSPFKKKFNRHQVVYGCEVCTSASMM